MSQIFSKLKINVNIIPSFDLQDLKKNVKSIQTDILIVHIGTNDLKNIVNKHTNPELKSKIFANNYCDFITQVHMENPKMTIIISDILRRLDTNEILEKGRKLVNEIICKKFQDKKKIFIVKNGKIDKFFHFMPDFYHLSEFGIQQMGQLWISALHFSSKIG